MSDFGTTTKEKTCIRWNSWSNVQKMNEEICTWAKKLMSKPDSSELIEEYLFELNRGDEDWTREYIVKIEEVRIAWVKMLIRGNASKTTFDTFKNPGLFYALLTNYGPYHRRYAGLVDVYVHPANARTDATGNTFWHHMAINFERCCPWVIEEFMLSGADPHIKNNAGISGWDLASDDCKSVYNAFNGLVNGEVFYSSSHCNEEQEIV